jgi:hypothetical protein
MPPRVAAAPILCVVGARANLMKETTALGRFRHYLNLDRTEARSRRLLTDFSWDWIDRVFLEPRT